MGTAVHAGPAHNTLLVFEPEPIAVLPCPCRLCAHAYASVAELDVHILDVHCMTTEFYCARVLFLYSACEHPRAPTEQQGRMSV